MSPSLEEIETSILAFSKLGVKVMFTELDISVLPSPWDQNGAEVSQNFKNFEGDKKMNPFPKNLPNSMKTKLAERYENIFKLFCKKSPKLPFGALFDEKFRESEYPPNADLESPN